ncbi:hypothetical protein MUK71_03795 [Arthrobacter zhangbolii]|uniref:Uncharacterized protein n=1 Tax=Arthrobacter zhangbolii TaxID=2886936 RepID=A0A9X1SA70_9MICC|nr:hypothetical protein [Arthrobacter zhangbolii]MCC3273236.1 hypothetical protein [Arthrobacter zhangbolii]UON93750.1 hypothetical protein MUK71_03795 [Arthrobacter zhangbolii]
MLGLAAVLLCVLALRGTVGIAAWMLAMGLLLLVTALYSLGFRRRSWAALDTVQQKRLALTGSGLVLVLGMAAGAVAAPQLRPAQPTAEDVPQEEWPKSEPLPPPLPLPAEPPAVAPDPDLAETNVLSGMPHSGTSLAGAACATPGDARGQDDADYRCTQDDAGRLVWMERAAAERLAAQRAERAARDAAQQPPAAPRPANPPQQPPAAPAPAQKPPQTPSEPPEPPSAEPSEPAPSPSAPPTIPAPEPELPTPSPPPVPPEPSPTAPGTPRIPSPQPPAPVPGPPSSPRIAEPAIPPVPALAQSVS